MTPLNFIISRFKTEGVVQTIIPYGNGHINDTFLVTTTDKNHPGYILQKINHHIFRNVPDLINNILLISNHISAIIESNSAGAYFYEFPRLIQSDSSFFYHHDADGNFWRLYPYIPGSRSYDNVPDKGLAYEGGRAFGIFQKMTVNFDAASLVEIIPDFHNISTRIATFRQVVSDDTFHRVSEVNSEIEFVEKRCSEMHTILRLAQAGSIPLRVTHNDTKFNNILFNNDNKAISIVDLDTVMPGYVLYDFGDAIRTGAASAAEDEADLSKVHINLELFKAYADGYLSVAREFLIPEEIRHLAFSAKYMTYLIGLRFLTDFLDGDRYYKTSFPGHNLRRARSQFKLLESMELHFGEMENTIHNIVYFAEKSN